MVRSEIQDEVRDICLSFGIPDISIDTVVMSRIAKERSLAKAYASLATVAPSVPWPAESGVDPQWAAGFFDGEGHCGINRHIRKVNGRPQYLTRCQIGNTERYLLEPFSVFGGLTTDVQAGRWNPNAAQCFKWTIHNRYNQNFILAILPYLKNSRKVEAAKLLLSVEFLRKSAGGNTIDNIRLIQQEHYYREILKINKRGESFSRPAPPPAGIKKEAWAAADAVIALSHIDPLSVGDFSHVPNGDNQ